MHLPSLFSLPPAILALLCATPSTADPQWPHNLPRHMKYFPEDEILAKRSLSVKQRLQHEAPIGVRKMSLDAGEMFMLENWIFASDVPFTRSEGDKDEEWGNGTVKVRSPLRPVTEDDFLARMHIRDILLKRQFKCPDGTNSCSDIGAPDVCCGTGSTCINVNGNSDAGSVGCCPQGQTCAGAVSCDTANGYSACPNSSNGGCCLPGFSCQGIGCVFQGTSVVTVQPPASSSPPRTSSTAVVVVPTSPSPSTTSTPPPTSSSSSSSQYTCSTGWFSCPASLNGGCCQNGRTCAPGASCLGSSDPTPTTTQQAPSAPVRPTSGSAGTTPANDICPTGFYVCSAYYPSGCCRVGRDCQTTGSCGLPTSTILDTNGVVIVAPTGAGVASTAGSCPSMWYSCAADRGGNCCPSGYECGEQCTATASASGQAGVKGKVAPSTAGGSRTRVGVMVFVSLAVTVGIGMVGL